VRTVTDGLKRESALKITSAMEPTAKEVVVGEFLGSLSFSGAMASADVKVTFVSFYM